MMTAASGYALLLFAVGALVVFPAAGLAAQASARNPQDKYQVEVRVMLWADASEPDAIANQQATISDVFVRRARLVLQGRPSESLSFSVQLGQDNIGGKVLTNDGSIKVKDAYISYRLVDALQFTAGQFKVPFLRANLESGFNQVLVDRGTLPTFRPAREGSRDLGMMVWGNVRALQYRMALFDGSDQEVRNAESSIRASTRVAYNWFTRETGLGYTGSYLGANRVLQLAVQADLQGSRLDARDDAAFAGEARDYRAYAIEAFFEQPLPRAAAFTIDAAWFDREDDYAVVDLATRHVDGYYVQPAFLLPGRLGPGRVQFAVRHEAWGTEREDTRAETARTTAGANYYFGGHHRKIQIDYTRTREPPEIRNNEFRLSLVVVF